MNASDQNLLNWLNMEINAGKKKILVPAPLLELVTPEGPNEARRLAKLNSCELVMHV